MTPEKRPPGDGTTTSVLFVCMGNICRSPTAEGVFRKLVTDESLALEYVIESAGTHAYHVGEPADERSVRAAARRGIDISANVGRQVKKSDFGRFDHVLAMDRMNHRMLATLGGGKAEGRLRLFLDYAPELGLKDVPDPYFGGGGGFERVLDIVQTASRGLLDAIRRAHTT